MEAKPNGTCINGRMNTEMEIEQHFNIKQKI